MCVRIPCYPYHVLKSVYLYLKWFLRYSTFEAKIVLNYGKFDYFGADAAITAHVYYVRQNALC